ncbi:mycothiol synthase [Frondihabitans sp. PhB188]|uniref:mycothiol synthase n=1 Tax=Frondihabitans sp. PhB188 TaxID=2485200 RepID=UPI000F470A02|nr:mycothiol synthase [Frondihabitans sp. PhB188]ROQ37525.1 mycothiol synthase [Frondihabitans sp. PhB188]
MSSPHSALTTLAAEAAAADGAPPFSDQALVEARSGDARVIGGDDAAAILRPGEAELVVRPSARGRGLGTSLLHSVLDATTGPLAVWAHGDHPGARRLAEGFGFTPTRRLLQQRASVPSGFTAQELPGGTTVRAFRPGADDTAWLELNARAFASHPEQGSLTQLDLDARMAEEWFDADDFLLLSLSDELVAFAWLKVEPDASVGEFAAPIGEFAAHIGEFAAPIGEFYAVGVSPDHQGEHLGGAVVDAGLARLAARGVATASLYVEGDNDAALGLYATRGFTDHAIDVQYSLAR